MTCVNCVAMATVAAFTPAVAGVDFLHQTWTKESMGRNLHDYAMVGTHQSSVTDARWMIVDLATPTAGTCYTPTRASGVHPGYNGRLSRELLPSRLLPSVYLQSSRHTGRSRRASAVRVTVTLMRRLRSA